jgi:F0F1-type ATP synthase membrane subunit b/b'
MPWNPQRIEQRIGRCHRYGQKFDVVVVNFLNKSNAADQRVYELLNEKFRLFDGVFGSSDEILGAVESGVDFEKRIAEIYQKCRSAEQIQFEFDQLQRELETEIAEGQQDAREKLLNNFDQEVVEKVRIQSNDYLDRFNKQLWLLTRSLLKDHAHFNEQGYSFTLHTNPFPGETIHPGPYRMGKQVEEVNTYRVGHPLAQRLLEQAKNLPTPPCELTLDYSNSGKRIAILDSLNGKSGWLMCSLYSVSALETEDYLVLSGSTDNGETLDEKQIQRFFDLPCISDDQVAITDEVESKLVDLQTIKQNNLLEELTQRNANWFEIEIDKLDRWAEDRRKSLQVELDELDETIKETRKAARLAPNLPEKLAKQQTLRKLESKRDEAWRNYDAASRDLDKKKDELLDEISQRLEQNTKTDLLFILKWNLR